MQQQTPGEAGKPWNKVTDLGSNMRQLTSGPDGNPLSAFTGKSGVQIAIEGAGEPEMKAFGELYANFLYSGTNGGTMEIPLVRGASLMTHILRSANPVVKPFCLSSLNGNPVKFDCPLEPSAGDGGGGHLEGECRGSVLTITLHNSKVIRDLTKVQWAAESKVNWGNTYMRTCDANLCSLEDGGKTLKVRVPNAAGTMNFAVNYIGHYLLPPDWTNQPGESICTSKRGILDLHMSATCQPSRDMTIIFDLGSESFPGLDMFQYALEPANVWQSDQGYIPPMRTCTPGVCQHIGNKVVIKTTAPANNYKLALNVIGARTFPYLRWLEEPYQGVCDGSTITDGSSSSSSTTTPSNNNNNNSPDTTVTTKSTQPPTTPPTTLPSTPRSTTPQNTNTPPAGTSSYPSVPLATPTTKFVMELDEPGNDLPGVTRKFILYFTSPVVPKVDSGSQTIRFEPPGGGAYSGLLQLGYVGSSARGDGSQTSFLDPYAGIYPYKPQVQYCVSRSAGRGFLNFQWNPVDVTGDTARTGRLLMVSMPHHDLLMLEQAEDTPFTFKAYVSNDWLMELPVLHTDIDPDPLGVIDVKDNPSQLQDILAAIERDAQNQNLDAVCGHTDSYNGGKAIGMVPRLASLSRAFATDHYVKLDESIRSCLEQWLRIQDTLDEMWKLRYEDVWGGLFLRATGDAVVDWGVDYGFPYYNDHHFHLGYFLYAAAYYVKHHQAWGRLHKDRLYSLARDVGNPSNQDAFFPVSRQKDIYTGFSWASGLVPGTRQEESASEGINCYHALAALGGAFGDDNMRQTGQILLAMEIHSVREYWQVRAHNKAHFPPAIQEYGVVGMVTEPAFFAYTLNWPCYPNIFPQRHACLVGIQVIPITAVSKYWMDKEWAQSINTTCQYAINPSSHPSYHLAEKTRELSTDLESGWKAFCHAAMAPLDSAHALAAANYVRDKKPQELVGGTGAASTLLFIYART
ncbi:hypothetical protein EGW08_017983 [Elysia chlorotica]|uniref:glucan endo-1,3-beta-D-glucosidase n=1 Tax=Elysia chlorotica TaxID=188477 RepID=A0A433SY51_ELYCH|nr:hypothetical protein EGW08_017983 [Elysia chlorotica]